MKNPVNYLLLFLSVIALVICKNQLNAQCGSGGSLFINEVGNPADILEGEFIELVVVGDPANPSAPVNLEGWIIDDNNAPAVAVGNEPGHIVLGACFGSVDPGTIILIYDDERGFPGITSTNNGNSGNLMQIPFSDACIQKIEGCPNHEDGSYCDSGADDPTPPSEWDYPSLWNQYIPMRNFGDVIQVRNPAKELVHALSWVEGFSGNAGGATISIAGKATNKSFQFTGSSNWLDDSAYASVEGGYSPGQANSPENEAFIQAILSQQISAGLSVTVTTDDATMLALNDGAIHLDVNSGSLPISVIISNGSWSNQIEVVAFGTYDFNNLQTGNYTIQIEDANGCTANSEINVGALSNCGNCPEIGVATEMCFKWIPTTGLLDPNSSLTQACPYLTTEYRLVISDGDGNIAQDLTYTVKAQVLDVSIYPEDPILCGESSVSLEALVSQSGGNYSYLWSNGETGQIILVNAVGSYTVTVTDHDIDCESEATILVTGTDLTVTINSANTEVCTGSPIALEAIPSEPEGEYSYEWSGGQTGSVINVDEPGLHSVTVTDLANGCEANAEITLTSSDITVGIIPQEPVVCPGGETALGVDGGPYQTVLWNTGETATEITVTDLGEYSVTVTNNLGCEATATVEVKDANDPDAIKAFFESKGFYCIDIEILGPAFAPTGGDDKRLLSGNFCDPGNPDLCSGGANCVVDEASLQISISGSAITTTQMESAIIDNFQYFSDEFQYNSGKAFITKNEGICACGEYLANVEEQFENGELAYWVHLWESGTASPDKLFILANVPSLAGHTPGAFAGWHEYMDGVLQAVANDVGSGNLPSEAEQVLFALMDNSLDNHLSLAPPINQGSGSHVPVCESFEMENAIGLTPADIPLQLPSQTILRFGAPPHWTGSFPDGALGGFTVNSSTGGGPWYYNGRPNAAGFDFVGYYEITVKGGFVFSGSGNLSTPYISQPYVTPPLAVLGYQTGTASFEAEQREYLCTLPTSLGKGAGSIVSDLDLACLGDPIQSPDPYNIDLPPITTNGFTSSDQNKICNWWEEGSLIKIQRGNGYSDYFYIVGDESNPDNYTFYQWNCATGLWEPYTPDDPTLTDQLVLEYTLCEFSTDGGYDPETEDLGVPKCFELSAEQIGDFSFTGSPNSSGNIIDHIGLDGTEIAEINSAIANGMGRWGMDMDVILSGDYQPDQELPINSIGPAQDDFDNFDMASTDVLYWIHYRNNGTASFCLKFGDDYFDGIPDEAERKEAKAVMIDAIKDGRDVKMETHVDNNPVTDPDDPPAYPLLRYFGIRAGYEDEVNFWGVTKELAGIGKQTIINVEIPEQVWHPSGDCLFDTPGPVIGFGNAIGQENPVAAAAQMLSFGVSVVKDKQTRDAIVHAVTHPGKVARGILKEKHDIYSGQSGLEVEVVTYNASFDGVSIILAIAQGKAIFDLLKKLSKKAKEAAKTMAKHLDEAPHDFDHQFFQQFENVGAAIQEEFLEFFKDMGPHFPKLTKNPKLFHVWNAFKGGDVDLLHVFKRFPDENPAFYSKFDEVFFEGNVVKAKAEDFLRDVDGNDNLLNIFVEDHKAIDGWDVLNDADRPNLRKKIDSDLLKKLGDLVDDNDFQKPGGFGWEKAEFVETFKKHDDWGYGNQNKPYIDDEGIANYLGNTMTADELTDALKLVRDAAPQPPRVGDVLQNICCSGDLQYIGAEWQLRYSKNRWNDISSFERVDNSNGVQRIIDVDEFDGSFTKRVELKSWSSFNQNYNFAGQFSKDIIQVDELSDMKWVFDGKGAFSSGGSPNYEYLLENARTAITQHSNDFANNNIIETFVEFAAQNNPSFVIGNVNDLMDFINNTDDWFYLIFKIE
ncbi:MAG TPA: hypothetical protein ENJ95_18145 [Bacteroidetes bacterium]|nr:hypothetical protein [Bacteroidota bacterium]